MVDCYNCPHALFELLGFPKAVRKLVLKRTAKVSTPQKDFLAGDRECYLEAFRQQKHSLEHIEIADDLTQRLETNRKGFEHGDFADYEKLKVHILPMPLSKETRVAGGDEIIRRAGKVLLNGS